MAWISVTHSETGHSIIFCTSTGSLKTHPGVNTWPWNSASSWKKLFLSGMNFESASWNLYKTRFNPGDVPQSSSHTQLHHPGIWYNCKGARSVDVLLFGYWSYDSVIDNSDSPYIVEQLSQGLSFSCYTFISDSFLVLWCILCLMPGS